MINFTLTFLSISSIKTSPYFVFPLQSKSHYFSFSIFSSKFSRFLNTALLSTSTNNLIVKKCDFLHFSNSAIIVRSNDFQILNKYITETIKFSSGNLIINNCKFKNCNAPETGGALEASEINVGLICTYFHRNTAPICGAAHLISCFSIQWFGNVFTQNEADYNGAFTIDTAEINNLQTNVTIKSTNISLNKAKMWTGGFRIDTSGGKISNCIIYGNTAKVTGGFFDFSWTPAHRDVIFCIFNNNTSKMRGGAVCAFHLMHSSRYFKSVFVKNKCDEDSDAISIQSIDSKIVLDETFFDGTKENQIGMKFGFSKFEIMQTTKFGIKDNSMKKVLENIEQAYKLEMKNQCNDKNS
ncbi:hypothetical protein M9Y10_044467 [Tritrichomonas musculus]|uniref:Right handed beta helix domain-containing protein n=1 Tax=Tritrichomonas musculus TaxID=1915356 RepID=A0ABR2JSG5_9EUKA